MTTTTRPRFDEPAPEPGRDDDLDELRDLWAEVQAEKDQLEDELDEDATPDPDAPSHDLTEATVAARAGEVDRMRTNGLLPPLPGYTPGGRIEAEAGPTMQLHPGESYMSADQLTAVLDTTSTTTDADAATALADATTGLVDAIARLVDIGYPHQQAVTIVGDLIYRLATYRPAA